MSKALIVHFEGKDMPMSEWLELISLRDAARRGWSGMSDDELVAVATTTANAELAMAAAAEMQHRADEALRRSGGKLDTPLRDLTDTRWRSH